MTSIRGEMGAEWHQYIYGEGWKSERGREGGNKEGRKKKKVKGKDVFRECGDNHRLSWSPIAHRHGH